MVSPSPTSRNDSAITIYSTNRMIKHPRNREPFTPSNNQSLAHAVYNESIDSLKQSSTTDKQTNKESFDPLDKHPNQSNDESNDTTNNEIPSLDYFAIGNHIFVFCQVCYIGGNFFRSLMVRWIDQSLSDDLLNAIFVCLAVLYFIDSIMYYLCSFDLWPTKGIEIDRSIAQSSNRANNQSSDTEDLTTSSEIDANIFLHIDVAHSPFDLDDDDQSINQSVNESINQTLEHFTPRPLFPLTLDGVAELMNILPSILCVVSSLMPFLVVIATDNSGNGDQSISQQNIIDLVSMVLWTVDSILYTVAWYRYEYTQMMEQKSMPVSPSNSSSTGSSNTPRRKSFLRNWYFWSNFTNILASLIYLFSVCYTFALIHIPYYYDEQRSRYDYRVIQAEQRTAELCGDVIYLACAVCLEIAWFQDKVEEIEIENEPSVSDAEEEEIHSPIKTINQSIDQSNKIWNNSPDFYASTPVRNHSVKTSHNSPISPFRSFSPSPMPLRSSIKQSNNQSVHPYRANSPRVKPYTISPELSSPLLTRSETSTILMDERVSARRERRQRMAKLRQNSPSMNRTPARK